MNELLIDLDSSAKTALYEQIYEAVKADILDGRLSRGERLPSARLLALNLQISRSTVDAAYGQLAGEGYIKAKRGSGYYVCDAASLYDFTKRPKEGQGLGHLKTAEENPPDGPVRDGYGKECTGKAKELRYHFLPGQIDSGGFAYNAWRRCAKEALLELEAGQKLLPAGHPQGEYELRKTIAAYLYRARGVRCTPEQIVVGAGNEYLLQLLGQFLKGPRSVAMESPTYLQAYHTFHNIGYEVITVPMDMDGMRAEEIPKEGVSLAYVMPSHQFPMGCIMPLERRAQLLAWAQRQQAYIIEDDHDSEFRYKGRPIPSLQGMAGQDTVIYLGTFSNSIMPSIRISYMVLPQKLLHMYKNKCGFYASTVSVIQQMTVCRFLESGCFERHLNKMRGIYKGKRDMLLQLLKKEAWADKIYGDAAGLHIAVKLNCTLPEAEVVKRAADAGLWVQGISACYTAGQKKPDANPILLLGFGNLSPKQMQEGMAVLRTCIV